MLVEKWFDIKKPAPEIVPEQQVNEWQQTKPWWNKLCGNRFKKKKKIKKIEKLNVKSLEQIIYVIFFTQLSSYRYKASHLLISFLLFSKYYNIAF